MEVKSYVWVGFTLRHSSENTLLIFKQIARVSNARKIKAMGTETPSIEYLFSSETQLQTFQGPLWKCPCQRV